MRNAILFVVLLLVAVLAAVFAALNPEHVELELAFAQVSVRKSVALAIAFGFGFALGFIVAMGRVFNLMRERRALKKSVRLAEAEVNNLRSLPLRDGE